MKKLKLPTFLLIPLDDDKRVFVLHTKEPKFIGEIKVNSLGDYYAEPVSPKDEKMLVKQIMDKAVSVVPKELMSEEFKLEVYSKSWSAILDAMSQWYFFKHVNTKTRLSET